MKKIFITSAVALFLLCGCSTNEPQITQISTVDALHAGVYEGSLSVEQLREYGNLGLGTADQLDGEMIVLDGNFYHVWSDGKVYLLPECKMIPFGMVVDFKAEKEEDIGAVSMDEFLKKLDQLQPDTNAMAVFKMSGKFTKIKTRTVPRQKKPYPPLMEVMEHQQIYEFKNVEGHLIGFRFPCYMKGINIPGWHLHFLRKDKKAGGHVFSFQTQSGKLESSAVYHFHMILPKDSEEFRKADFSKDRSAETKKIISKQK